MNYGAIGAMVAVAGIAFGVGSYVSKTQDIDADLVNRVNTIEDQVSFFAEVSKELTNLEDKQRGIESQLASLGKGRDRTYIKSISANNGNGNKSLKLCNKGDVVIGVQLVKDIQFAIWEFELTCSPLS